MEEVLDKLSELYSQTHSHLKYILQPDAGIVLVS